MDTNRTVKISKITDITKKRMARLEKEILSRKENPDQPRYFDHLTDRDLLIYLDAYGWFLADVEDGRI